ncbi:MAG: hypothetical protein HZA34_04890 [Candidatus Pacebacteria bacterium]|nr:hypothetical protein [Candidatus Paceibacterota bacterium]
MKNTHEIIIPVESIPTIPSEDEIEGDGYKKTYQYFEQSLSPEKIPPFYKELPYRVKISTLYTDTVSPLVGGKVTGYEVFAEPDQHAHPEIYIPETGVVEFVYDGRPMVSDEQTQLIDHGKTEVFWDGHIFIGRVYLKKNNQNIPFEWSGGLKKIPLANEHGESEYYSIFGIPPNVQHDIINRTVFLRNSITTIEFFPK